MSDGDKMALRLALGVTSGATAAMYAGALLTHPETATVVSAADAAGLMLASAITMSVALMTMIMIETKER